MSHLADRRPTTPLPQPPLSHYKIARARVPSVTRFKPTNDAPVIQQDAAADVGVNQSVPFDTFLNTRRL